MANASGLEGATWNPAALDRGEKSALATFSHRSYIADIGVNFAGLGLRFERLGAVGFTVRSLNIGEIQVTDEYNMDGTGEVFQPTVFVVGGTYSKQMADRIRVGVSGHFINEDIAQVSATGFSFDAGVQYDQFLSVPELGIGVAVRNIGTAMKYDGPGLLVNAEDPDANRETTHYKVTTMESDMPTVIDIGMNYSPTNNLDVGLTYTENNYGPNELRVLGAYNIADMFILRGSYMRSPENQGELEDIFSGPSFGATLNLEPVVGTGINLDYGYFPVQYFASNHVFTVRFGLGM